MPDSRILLGVIGRAHGVRGLVRVTSHTADPADLTAYGPLSDDRGRRFVLRWRGMGVAEVAELVNGAEVKVEDRTQAEKLTNTRLHIDRAQLPPPEDEDEYYLTDLIGLTAKAADGSVMGRIAVVHDYGAGISVEIERDGRPALIVPFTRACVPVVDIAGGSATIVPPEETEAREDASDAADSPTSSSGTASSSSGAATSSSGLTRGSLETTKLGFPSDPRVKPEDDGGASADDTGTRQDIGAAA